MTHITVDTARTGPLVEALLEDIVAGYAVAAQWSEGKGRLVDAMNKCHNLAALLSTDGGVGQDTESEPSCDGEDRVSRIQRERNEARESLEQVVRERDTWMDTAGSFSRNAAYYWGLINQIGETLGPDAYTADDGTAHDGVLCAKVPDLVRARLAPQPNPPDTRSPGQSKPPIASWVEADGTIRYGDPTPPVQPPQPVDDKSPGQRLYEDAYATHRWPDEPWSKRNLAVRAMWEGEARRKAATQPPQTPAEAGVDAVDWDGSGEALERLTERVEALERTTQGALTLNLKRLDEHIRDFEQFQGQWGDFGERIDHLARRLDKHIGDTNLRIDGLKAIASTDDRVLRSAHNRLDVMESRLRALRL